jgi:hypothetical protein
MNTKIYELKNTNLKISLDCLNTIKEEILKCIINFQSENKIAPQKIDIICGVMSYSIVECMSVFTHKNNCIILLGMEIPVIIDWKSDSHLIKVEITYENV